MSTETLSTLAVGLALLAFGWRVYTSLRRDNETLRRDIDGLRLDTVDTKERLARVEATLELLVKGLHIEIRSSGYQRWYSREEMIVGK